ncbi:MAG: hypothetical protein RL141_953 [Candidatus Parcubacteria bacterium]
MRYRIASHSAKTILMAQWIPDFLLYLAQLSINIIGAFIDTCSCLLFLTALSK